MSPIHWILNKEVRPMLEAREGGKWRVPEWWQFGRNQNITEMTSPKILTQVLAKHASMTLDANGDFAFVGGGNAGGYGVRLKSAVPYAAQYVLALLNSKLLDHYLHQISMPFRGGFWSYARRFIEQLPIRPINFAVASECTEHDAIVKLVERILAAKRADPNADTTAWEREIDERVYRLYGLTDEEIKIVEEGTG